MLSQLRIGPRIFAVTGILALVSVLIIRIVPVLSEETITATMPE